MIVITEYILEPREGRTAHLKLEESCVERGGTSTDFRGLLAYVLGTTIPRGMKIHCCHACHNSRCSNPNHMYWGTPRENKLDADVIYPKTMWQRSIEKHGIEKAREIRRAASAKAAIVRKQNKLNGGVRSAGGPTGPENQASRER
jgi:hypothetical protein